LHREQLNIGEMKMKKVIMSLFLLGALPLTMMAQDDDMYFVPSKESKAKDAYEYGLPSRTYYAGSSRSVDEYNRRTISAAVPSDSVGNDIIDFSAVRGVYPDSVAPAEQSEDYQLTRRMSRFDDYTPSQAYWEGYHDGRWSSPWFYNSWYSWYDYDYWYWNNPYYYSSYYGWYSPWYYRYYGYYRPWYYGYYGGYYGPIWYSGSVRTTPHQGRRVTYRNNNRNFGHTNNTRTTYDNNRSFGSNRTTTNSGSFGGGARSGGGGFSGGGGGGARTSSGGRSFGGRR